MTPPAETLKPPVRSAAERGLDLLVWGGLIVLLLLAMKPVEMSKVTMLVTNSGNIRSPRSPDAQRKEVSQPIAA